MTDSAPGPGLPVARDLVAAVLDRMIPPDAAPGATAAGALDVLARHAGGDHARLWERWLVPGFAGLDADARDRHGLAFSALTADQQHALLADAEAGRTATRWTVAPDRFVAACARLAAEAYYGTRGGPGWAVVGYDPTPARGPGAEVVHRLPPTTAFAALAERYDVVVVGAGAGGGTAAAVLAEAGLRVLIAERGPVLPHAEAGRDHLRNHRLPVYGINTPPDPAAAGPRVAVDAAGNERVLTRPWDPGFQVMPQVVGGGSRVYQGMAWRLLPEDFRLASLYGVPDGSSLADWPIAYADLEPFYSQAEWELGVAGDGNAHRNQGNRSRPYPLPPPPANPEAEVLAAGAARLGWSTGPVPLLINTEPRDGRARCVSAGSAWASPARRTPRTAPTTSACPARWRVAGPISSRARGPPGS